MEANGDLPKGYKADVSDNVDSGVYREALDEAMKRWPDCEYFKKMDAEFRPPTIFSVMDAPFAVEAENIFFSYASELPVLRGLSMRVERGCFACVLGHSGCGKSTLLNLVMGLSRPSSGVVRNQRRGGEGPGTDRAIVFQDCSLFPWMTAQENVAFAIRHARKITKQASAALAADFLSQVGLYESRGKYPNQLSGGMKQRVAIARALAMDSEIWLFRRAVQRARPADAPLAPVARLRPREVRKAAHGALRHAQRRRGRDARREDTLHERRVISGDFEVPFGYPRVPEEIAGTQEYFSLVSRLAERFCDAGRAEEARQ